MDNDAPDSGKGGGLCATCFPDTATVTVTNCAFSGNTAGDRGGGMSTLGCTFVVTNCTFAGNTAESAGAINANAVYSPTITNSILWDNTATIEWENQMNDGSDPFISYSDITGGCFSIFDAICGDGNIESDPLFAYAASGDLHLTDGSPCIDTGSTAALPDDTADLDGDSDTTEQIPYDLDGNPRVVGDIVDMGAYELQP